MADDSHAAGDVLALADWRRRVFDLYREIRADPDPQHAWHRWRDSRDDLFANHPQSPLPPEDRASFSSLAYFDYDPSLRVPAVVVAAEPAAHEIRASTDGTYTFTRFATAQFELEGQAVSLALYWLEGYGGGIFLPFADTTSGATTYGAGRYLLDTVKGADLGMLGDELLLDFNFAYNPSCAYDPRWACPLAPFENRLPLEIRAGEVTPAQPV